MLLIVEISVPEFVCPDLTVSRLQYFQRGRTTRARFMGILAVLALLAALFYNPAPISAVRSSQTTSTIIGNGQICNGHNQCGSFQITFSPVGGPITGFVTVDWPITDMNSGQKIGAEVLQDAFTSEDGGW